MKYLAILLVSLSVAILGALYYWSRSSAKNQGTENEQSDDSLIACTLSDSELAERKKSLLLAIQPFIEEASELKDGYRFRFPHDGDLLPALFKAIELESKCCAFLEFSLKLEANKGPVWLRLTGPGDTKEFIKQNFLTQNDDD